MLRTLTLALLFALCGAISSANAQDKITVMLDWFVNPHHAPLIVAQEKGYFKAAGLDVK